jgi:acetylornithine/succinyldiaminopimelate/putrescine aminotransferase/acyl-coenzyme A synthetase/AMP-(fatty) acid ligase
MRKQFDLVIENPVHFTDKPVKTIGQILFTPLDGRDENCNIILSHIENDYTEISLFKLRRIVKSLISDFKNKDIHKGETVILLTFNGCNEMFTAIYFLALASMGCRVFMPMYSETLEFSAWVDLSHATHIILPEGEVMSLEGHEKEKSAVKEIKNIASNSGVKIWDNVSDFDLMELMRSESKISSSQFVITDDMLTKNPDDEVLIVTTSGSSGQSRLVVYNHKSYFLNCLAWEKAGFYNPDKLGGTGFTPLFTHTMGIRAFINALWTGAPVCLIITEWFIEKPEIVRYLLLNMKPAHITGGPAVYNAFIELFRLYPELKSELRRHFKTLVSSGAPYNPVTSKEIMNITGLHLHNAFGMTETQQIFSTLLSPPTVFQTGMIPLGKPLPGVSIGLKKSDTGMDHYRLFVKSIFGHKYCLLKDDTEMDDYFDTGDVVFCDDQGNLFYLGRANKDYFKDSFGVKIPLQAIHKYYEDLKNTILHAEFYPVLNFPGISALLFIRDTNIQVGLVQDRKILKKYAGIVEGINNRLIHSLETFEFQHRHVCRIAILNQSPPLTGKGSVSVKQILIDYHDLVERLTDTRKDATGIEITEKLYQITDKYTRFISPWIGSMMTAMRINLTYHRGNKDSLFSYIHGKETEVMDLVGGYGTNFTGHNHPAICKAITEFISSGKLAICNQLSVQQTTGLLAEKLNLIIGGKTGRSYQVTFGNSGAEAVEIAFHHAYLEWRKRIEKFRDQQIQVFGSEKALNAEEIWKINLELVDQAVVRMIGLCQAFHGHSTSARSLLGNAKYRNRFRQLSNIEPLFIDDRDPGWKEKLDGFLMESYIIINRIIKENGHFEVVPQKISTIIAAIAEPVIGEGGVRVVNRELLTQLASQEFPLISDEIQCGLGRTGNIPEFDSAHYYLFGKALGGGMEKISAVMIDSTRYCNDFSEYYASTFGNGELAAHTALTTLQIIETNKLCERSIDMGNYLKKQLTDIQNLYPSIIQDFQGKGLMQAVYFNPECTRGSILLRILFQTEKAGYLFAGWFLHRHRIRILPTLSAPNALRIEPSAYFEKSEADRFCFALEELCQILKDGRTSDLFSFMMDDDPFKKNHTASPMPYHYDYFLEPPDEDAVKVAFIAHFVFPLKEFRMLEPDLERASDTGLRIFFKRMQLLMEGKHVQIMASHLFKRKVHFSFYALALDSAELEYLHKSGKRRWVVSKIQETVDYAAAQGAKIISLGGYTSILTNNGLSVAEPPGTRIITGNTLTAASGLVHLGNTLREKTRIQ